MTRNRSMGIAAKRAYFIYACVGVNSGKGLPLRAYQLIGSITLRKRSSTHELATGSGFSQKSIDSVRCGEIRFQAIRRGLCNRFTCALLHRGC